MATPLFQDFIAALIDEIKMFSLYDSTNTIREKTTCGIVHAVNYQIPIRVAESVFPFLVLNPQHYV
jgi:hypothetical protein